MPAIASAADTEVLAADRVFPGREQTAARARSASHPPLVFEKNAQIGRFGLIRELARGGMGQVFLARDTKLGRKVAIKFLLRADPAFVARFLVEARATAQCTHENIITIHEVGEHDGLPYMVLEYLEGRTLLEMIETRLPTRQLTEIMLGVVHALERAHDHHIVHRDLKPSNIFVTRHGQVKVLDFGVARMFDPGPRPGPGRASSAIPEGLAAELDVGSEASTQAGKLVGTYPYMSPEQWGVGEVDHRSDIWAIGVMFWRALAGAHPTGSASPDVIRDRLLDLATPLPSIATWDPTIPDELAAIIDRCLARPKDARPDAHQLAAELQAFLTPRAEPAEAGGEPCPYRGLAAFGEGDAKYFFGRSNEVRTAVALLEAAPLLAVVGASGVGKSSFIHAGVVPAMRATAENWMIRAMRPGRAPLQRLAGLLDDLLPTGKPGSGMLAQLHSSPGLFGELIRTAAAARNQRVLIVIDQFEELFTLCEGDEPRRLFLAALLAAADDPSAPVRVVLSIRADFLDRLAVHKQFLAEVTRGLLFLAAPDEDNLREALVRPAELAGYTFEDRTIVDDMLAAVTSRGALPLLSFAATRLWDARDRGRHRLTAAAYHQMGGVGGAFARHADQMVASVPPPSQPLLRAMLTRLVTPEGTRAVVDRDELVGLATDRAEGERIVDQLVNARLVHMDSDVDQGATVEIVHEILITEWPTLRRWLDAGHALRGFLHELQQAARTWAARSRPSDLLWRGAAADEAVGHATRHVLVLSAIEREFLAAVRVHAARSRRRKLLAVASVFAALGLVIAGGTVAFVQVEHANAEAEHRADDAELARRQAQAAEAKVKKQLDDVTAAQAAKDRAEHDRRDAEAKAVKAEDKAQVFEGEARLSRSELEQRNAELDRALARARAEQARAVAATSAEHAANATLADTLARERERIRQLELEKRHIYSGRLH